MLGGLIDVAFLDAGSAAPLVKSGRLKALGISGSRRSPAMPDVALMREQGVNFEIDGWYGLFAPRGTPAGVVERLNQEVARVLTAPALRERLAQLNVADTPRKSSAQFAKTVRDDFSTWREIVISNNINVE
jgi:tripartite-type tricarboxylate transporter receptor subunit TctC